MPSIKDFSAARAEKWDEYVLRSKKASFFHLTGWKKVIEDTFGHRSVYLYAENNGDVCGILPMFYVNSWMFGRMLVSTAFAVYGGPIAERCEIETALVERAREIGIDRGVDYIELRILGTHVRELPHTDLYVTFRQALHDDPEENFSAMPREARRLVRKARKAGLKAEVGRERIDEFYEIYHKNVRRLGTPVFPKKLFRNLLNEFQDSCKILSVLYQGKVIAAVLTFFFKDTVLPYYGGSVAEYNNNVYAPNNFMYWELMKYGIEHGYKWFDFGRSKVGTGAYHFKRHFGMKPEPLNYQYILIRKKDIPNLNPTNPSYRALIGMWKRLPLRVTRILGPCIVKYIP